MSNEKRPVGSVSDASMSPFESLTTKVLPSRIWTRPLLIVSSSQEPRVGRRLRERGGPGRSRWKSTNSWTSPSTLIAPRSSAASAFVLPLAMPSNSDLSAETTQSARRFWRETARSPLTTVTSQRSVFFPSLRSNRTVPVAFSSSGSCPRSTSASKNSAVASVIIPPPRLSLSASSAFMP